MFSARTRPLRSLVFSSRAVSAIANGMLLFSLNQCGSQSGSDGGLQTTSSAGSVGMGGSAGTPPMTVPTTDPGLNIPNAGASPIMTMIPGDLPIGTATLGGTVWAPGNAPGSVPAGEEIPVSGALVQVSAQPLVDLPDGVHCAQCVAPSGRYALSDSKGVFQLPRLPSGKYLLTVRKGQFALQKPIEIKESESRMLPSALSTLPSIHSPSNGTWVPRVAIALGAYDSIENVLGKMGMGGVDADGIWRADGPGADRIATFDNGHMTPTRGQSSIAKLVGSIDELRKYAIVFIPCSDIDQVLLHDQKVLANLRQYVSEGGKLYVTDWSGSWHDNVFPAEVTFKGEDMDGKAIDTPASAYDPMTNHWDTSQFGLTDGFDEYDSVDVTAVDTDLFAWLNGQIAPVKNGGTAPIDASKMTLTDNWNAITSANDTMVGLDQMGTPVVDRPKVFVEGSNGVDGDGVKRPMTLTYQPAGCGRVLYSTYHTSQEPHQGLLPQERILLYLIMEISVCRVEPVPVTPVLK